MQLQALAPVLQKSVRLRIHLDWSVSYELEERESLAAGWFIFPYFYFIRIYIADCVYAQPNDGSGRGRIPR